MHDFVNFLIRIIFEQFFSIGLELILLIICKTKVIYKIYICTG